MCMTNRKDANRVLIKMRGKKLLGNSIKVDDSAHAISLIRLHDVKTASKITQPF